MPSVWVHYSERLDDNYLEAVIPSGGSVYSKLALFSSKFVVQKKLPFEVCTFRPF